MEILWFVVIGLVAGWLTGNRITDMEALKYYPTQDILLRTGETPYPTDRHDGRVGMTVRSAELPSA